MTTLAADPTPSLDRNSPAFARLWWILGVLCLSLLVIVVDNSILNVALPSLQRSLHAANSELQWMVDAYTLVFAGLLLTAGSLGDRFGRRGALQFGMAVFGLGSLLSAFATTPGQLIATRGLMGVGGAFIMPSTLSIITNVFPTEERGRAIALWASVAGAGIALGPISGGLLLSRFYWGSIFLVNLPLVALALIAGVVLIPDSKDPSHASLDVVGALLSIVGLFALVFAVIQAPVSGWGSPLVLLAFFLAVVVLALFFWWENRVEHPMLNIEFFKNPRFSAASLSITLIFFAMFGSMFLLTQYFQLVMNYSPLETGVRLLPMAVTMVVVSQLSVRLVERVGTKVIVATGMALAALALFSMVTLPSVAPSYPHDVLWRLILLAAGMGLVMPPATESIMGSLPRAKAGVGSAINDTTRQIGGALGVAVIGSIMVAGYNRRVTAAFQAAKLPQLVGTAKQGLEFALASSGKAPAGVRAHLVAASQAAFVAGMHEAVVVGGIAALLGVLIAARFLPAHAPTTDPDQMFDVQEEALEASPAPVS